MKWLLENNFSYGKYEKIILIKYGLIK